MENSLYPDAVIKDILWKLKVLEWTTEELINKWHIFFGLLQEDLALIKDINFLKLVFEQIFRYTANTSSNLQYTVLRRYLVVI